MNSRLAIATLVFVYVTSSSAAQPIEHALPTTEQRIIAAAVVDGLLTPEQFRERVLTKEENARILYRWERSAWVKLIPGLSEIILADLPILEGNDHDGFSVFIYKREDAIALVSINAAVVNATNPERAIKSLIAVAEAALPNQSGVASWLDQALKDSWRWENGRQPTPIVQRVIDGVRIAVFGVPPDFFSVFVLPDEP